MRKRGALFLVLSKKARREKQRWLGLPAVRAMKINNNNNATIGEVSVGATRRFATRGIIRGLARIIMRTVGEPKFGRSWVEASSATAFECGSGMKKMQTAK
jgi:hypothetical protein